MPIGLCWSISFDLLTPKGLAQGLPTRIELVVVEGEGVVNQVRQRTARSLVVRVEDDDHRPLAGASVVFALPMSGPSGQFANGSRNATVLTDNDGLAAARGFRTNQVPGTVQIYVTASYRGLRARTLITQIIEPDPGAAARPPDVLTRGSGGKWKWLVGIAAAGGAGAAIYFGTRPQSNSPISITTGPVVFGSPR
jgi:hypothetical protein